MLAITSKWETSTAWPRPVRSRAQSAAIAPMKAWMPLQYSLWCGGPCSGGRSGSPLMYMCPAMAKSVKSELENPA